RRTTSKIRACAASSTRSSIASAGPSPSSSPSTPRRERDLPERVLRCAERAERRRVGRLALDAEHPPDLRRTGAEKRVLGKLLSDRPRDGRSPCASRLGGALLCLAHGPVRRLDVSGEAQVRLRVFVPAVDPGARVE